MTKEEIQQLFTRCQGTRRWILGTAITIALAMGGTGLKLLWEVRGDVQYTKGRVDVMARDRAPAHVRPTSDVQTALKDKEQPCPPLP